jgi:hypothetical protein
MQNYSKYFKSYRLILFLSSVLSVLNVAAATESQRLKYISFAQTADELKQMSIFTFAAMSDNKGEGMENSDFSHCVNQIFDLDAEFIIGLGVPEPCLLILSFLSLIFYYRYVR